jgi:hypothetical protein
MSTTFHAYGASSPRAPLEPLSFDPGELRPEEVETSADTPRRPYVDTKNPANENAERRRS